MLEITHPCFPRYRIREDGQVTGPRSVVKPYLNERGYHVVGVRHEGKYYSRMVHRLVCEAFHGLKTSPEQQVRHLDGNSLNNHYTNLRWGTTTEQMDDRALHGTTVIDRDIATRMRELFATRKWTQKDLAAMFRCSRGAVADVLANRLWRDEDYVRLSDLSAEHRSGEKNPAAALTGPVVREIRAKYATGTYTNADLATEYGVVKATITYLLANQTWVDPDYAPVRMRKFPVKMTYERAEDLRCRFAAQGVTGAVFARQENISQGLLSMILSRKVYTSPK